MTPDLRFPASRVAIARQLATLAQVRPSKALRFVEGHRLTWSAEMRLNAACSALGLYDMRTDMRRGAAQPRRR